MYRHILLPVDLSERTAAALERAIALHADGCRVTLLHVIEEIRDVPAADLEGFYADLESRADEALARAVARLAEAGVDSEAIVERGRRGPEILRFALDQGCDLVVMASRPVTPAQPAGGLGTISQQVALLAPCDVLLVR